MGGGGFKALDSATSCLSRNDGEGIRGTFAANPEPSGEAVTAVPPINNAGINTGIDNAGITRAVTNFPL
jgi:hypothetical protein